MSGGAVGRGEGRRTTPRRPGEARVPGTRDHAPRVPVERALGRRGRHTPAQRRGTRGSGSAPGTLFSGNPPFLRRRNWGVWRCGFPERGVCALSPGELDQDRGGRARPPSSTRRGTRRPVWPHRGERSDRAVWKGLAQGTDTLRPPSPPRQPFPPLPGARPARLARKTWRPRPGEAQAPLGGAGRAVAPSQPRSRLLAAGTRASACAPAKRSRCPAGSGRLMV